MIIYGDLAISDGVSGREKEAQEKEEVRLLFYYLPHIMQIPKIN